MNKLCVLNNLLLIAGMERAVKLGELREAGRLPAEFEARQPAVCRLVRWLTATNPADRPSAKELLQSDVLPPVVEDEQLKDLLRSLPDNVETFERVVEAVFSAAGKPNGGGVGGGQAVSAGGSGSGGGAGAALPVLGRLPPAGAPGAPQAADVHLRDAVLRHVRNVFACHGLVPMSSAQVCHG